MYIEYKRPGPLVPGHEEKYFELPDCEKYLEEYRATVRPLLNGEPQTSEH